MEVVVVSRLRDCRERAGYSQKQVALILKVKAPSVSNWEKGKTRPTRDNLEKLADLYHVSVDFLMERNWIFTSAVFAAFLCVHASGPFHYMYAWWRKFPRRF